MTRPDHDAEQDAVRRLLAESRHDAPLPDDVRARLDDVLAGLTAERRELRATEPVVDLSARRRQRRRGALLAAAAVVVAGVGLGQVLEGFGGSDQMVGDASSAQDGSGASEKRAQEGSSDADAEAPSAMTESRSLGAESDAALPTVRSTHLREDLRRLRTDALSARQSTPDLLAGRACSVTLTGPGRQVQVTLDGDPALAVFRPAVGGRQAVEVYACADGEETHRLQLRVR